MSRLDPAARGVTALALALLLVVGLTIRLWALELPGHAGDVRIIARWADEMAEHGSLGFYSISSSVYPALLYLLWPLGLALDGDALSTAVKGLSIPFDLGACLVLFTLGARHGRPGLGLGTAALYLLNPGTIIAGPVWGQVDAAGTLAFLCALIVVAGRHHAAAGALAMLATLLKPQFGLAMLAVGVVATLRSRRERRASPALRTAIGAGLAYAIVTGPLALSPIRYVGLLLGAAERQPFTSLHAFNPWALVVGFKVPDHPYVAVGTILLVAGLVVSLLPLRRRRDLGMVLAVGGMLAMALYFLPTRVHERYLFPVLALLAPLAAAELRVRLPYIVLSLAYATTLSYALVEAGVLHAPEPIAAILVSTPAVWILTLTMMTSALVIAIPFMQQRGPPKLGASVGSGRLGGLRGAGGATPAA